jgi:hypothetical protein
MTPAPTQNPIPFQPGNQTQTPTQMPTGGNLGGGGGNAVAIAGGGFGGNPTFPGMGTPIGTPPVPPRIVQEAGIPSQATNVDQDPRHWSIVESLGLVGTYDIIDKSGDIVMLGFRTVKDAEEYLNYFISYYNWVRSGSSGITPPGGGGTGGGNIGAGGAGPSTGGLVGPQGGGFGNFFPSMAGGGLGTPGGGGIGGGGTGGGGGCPYHCSQEGNVWWIEDADDNYPESAPHATQAACQSRLAQICGGAGGGGTGTGGGVGTGGGNVGGIGAGMGTGVSVTAGNASAQAGGGGAFAQAGNAIASAGNAIASAFAGESNKKLGSTPTPDMPFEEIPRAQGPFRSGQDNQEPIFDNSGIKIGADFGSPEGGPTTMEEVQEGKKSKFRRRRERGGATAIAIAGEAGAFASAVVGALERLFGDLMINLTLNNMIDGNMVNRSMNKYQLKKVSVFS